MQMATTNCSASVPLTTAMMYDDDFGLLWILFHCNNFRALFCIFMSVDREIETFKILTSLSFDDMSQK